MAATWEEIEAAREARRVRWQLFVTGALTYAEYAAEAGVRVLGRDATGWVAESDDVGFPFYLTDCCGASAKGVEDGVACRSCYRLIDPMLGGIPGEDGPGFYRVTLR